MFDAYLAALRRTPLDQQTEMTGRAALQALLEAAATAFGPPGVTVVHEPKRVAEGAPDYKLVQASGILGYVETKGVGHDLGRLIRRDPQIAKYRKLTPNLLVTDYLRFILVTPAEIIETTLGPQTLLEGKPHPPRPEHIAEVEALLRRFLSAAPVGIGRARDLAEALAVRAQLLRDGLATALVAQVGTKRGGKLLGLYGAFRDQVSHDLTTAEFADAFAQTLAYGLFLAKLNAGGAEVTLDNAHLYIPASVPLLRELVDFLPEVNGAGYAAFRWVVGEVLAVVNGLDLPAIHEDLAFRNRRAPRGSVARSDEEWRLFSRDPFIYFYEDFLAKYDAKTRKTRGVYYTPPPVVNFIVRAVHDTLKTAFGIAGGLADRKRVTVLDFAAGTGTFIVEVLERIFDEIGGPAAGKAGLVVREHMLKNIFGFEYLVAPYTIAHLKLASYLRETGHPLGAEERFQVYLTNTVEPIPPTRNLFLPALSDETEAAQAIKERPILVITGNPPYAGHSRNNGPVATASVAAYRVGIPELSKPGQAKWLQDDYVKFIRFAQKKVDDAGEGIVAVITNHSFLDNPTFRGMRASLMASFDQIRVIDLHGNAKKRERAPDGGEDKNVFDIEQGVAISLFVKRPGIERGVWHADLWGTRQAKYEWTARTALADVPWQRLTPAAPLRLFVPRDAEREAHYRKFWSVPEIMAVNGDPAPGIVTTHDEFAISFTPEEAVEKVERLLATKDEAEARTLFRLCSQEQWSYSAAKESLELADLRKLAANVHYFPFDRRWTLWSPHVAVHRRERVTRHLKRPNIGLITNRTQEIPGEWSNVLVVDGVAQHHSVSSKEVNYLFPLYLYAPPTGAKPRKADLFDDADPFAGKERIENIAPAFRKWLDARLGRHHSPEAVLGYIYAVLHAPTYRATYAEFLRSDFPRIPFPESDAVFTALSELGAGLVEAHLLRAVPKRGLGGFEGRGDERVEAVRYSPGERRIHINATQGFADVPPEVWGYTIGGYQVLDKYLKSRRGRVLSLDEIENVEAVANVLAHTIELVTEIDAAYRAAFLTALPGDDTVPPPMLAALG